MREVAEPLRTPLATWSRRLALFGVLAVLAAIALHRSGVMQTRLAMSLAASGMGFAALAFVLGLVAVGVIWHTGRAGAWSAAAGLLTSLALFAWPASVAPIYLRLPHINDITTDFVAPPAMVALARLRGAQRTRWHIRGPVSRHSSSRPIPTSSR